MDAYDTLAQLNSILTIFTLHNISRKIVLGTTKWPYLKMTFILLCFGLMYVYNMYYHFFIEELSEVNLSVKITETLSSVFGYLQYVIDLYFVYKYGGQPCVAYYETYDDIDKYFEMKYHREIWRNVLASIVMFVTLWLIASVSDYTAWFLSFGWESPTTYIVAYFTFLIRMLTILELNSHSMHIGYRLKTIADVLRDHFSLAEDLPSCVKVAKVVEVKSVRRIMPLKMRDDNEINRLGSYYLLLSKQATFLNNFFGVRVSLEVYSSLQQLRALVTTRPIRFHAANFFNLDSTLLLSTASVVATYAVILLQTTS
ncbi:uncharacterized protein [Choristoneura fumiferana]|uniref:uncharacterized protein n=1 Tax=Choristoneura fumiferana TaxID=7141 RepID=UPI003D15BDD9